jgi:hypothetical protein
MDVNQHVPSRGISTSGKVWTVNYFYLVIDASRIAFTYNLTNSILVVFSSPYMPSPWACNDVCLFCSLDDFDLILSLPMRAMEVLLPFTAGEAFPLDFVRFWSLPSTRPF